MKKFILSHCSYFLLLLLCSCGVKGPLYLPTKPSQPSMPNTPEPTGKLFIDERVRNSPIEPSNTDPDLTKKSLPSDNIQTTPSNVKN